MKLWKSGTAAMLTAALVGGAAAMISTPALAQETVTLELWSRADPSGPLRPGNVVKAAELLNAELEAEGSDKRVEVVVRESPAKGFDDDALQLLKVFGIGEGPDMFIQAHEWICAFQADGFVLKLDDYVAKYPDQFGTIFPSLWESVKCPDGIYGIPQDAEARMFFYNKKLLRAAGYDDAFIEAMPQRTLDGDLTMDELIDIAKQVVDKTGMQVRNPAPAGTKARTTSWYSTPTATISSTLKRAISCSSATSLPRPSAGSSARQGRSHSRQPHCDGIRLPSSKEFYTGNARILDVRHLGSRQRRLPDLRAAERRGRLLRRLGMDRRSPLRKRADRRAA